MGGPRHKRRLKTGIHTVADAETEFRRRTGLDPHLDPMIRRAVLVAALAEIFRSVQAIAAWSKPLRAAAQDIPQEPAVWAVKRAGSSPLTLGAAAKREEGVEVPIAQLHSEAVEIALKLANLRKYAAELLVQIRAFDRPVLGVRREIEAKYQVDGSSWSVETPGHRPIEWQYRRFLNSLHNQRQRAGQSDLTATEITFLAICVGIDEPPGDDMPKLVAKWAKRIRDAKSAT